jgi:predicted nucleotidyltransferase
MECDSKGSTVMMTLLQELVPELADQVQALVEVIAAEPCVKKVILFGSSVCGRRNKDSDIDILILVENADINEVAFTSAIRLKSYDLISFPLDLIVETVDEFLERSVLPTMERKIAREGRVLYAA